ncbi:MAG: hypothetical protein PHF16_02435 [Atribacterota bacterium]|jgi:hypothetical protein|nr:hypothetical protein [Atribacterota bacterium]
MIPDFNKHGNLPAGIYRASIDDIEKRFGLNSKKRISLFSTFNNFLELIIPFKTNIKQIILDGSFVTTKENPGDIDCIILIKDNTRFTPEIVDKLVNAKKLYNIHLFIREERNIKEYKKLLDLFSKDRDLKLKGVIEVVL